MDKFNLADVLGRYGIDDATAGRLKGKMQGDDLMNLVNYLTGPQGVQLSKASAILGKYGVKLGSSKPMENYLNAKYESVRNGRPLDETFGGVMTKVSEGYTYAVEVSEQSRDRVLDWLDENSVNYQATSPTNYRIECGDREGAYRTGRALSEILRKPTVRDSVETVEEKMSKNPNKRVNDAKDKMSKITPKDPNRQAATMRSGAGYHKGETDLRKVDKGARGAKYKPRYDEEIEEPITEGVMGMKPVNPLFRLRELAGLPELDEDDFEGIEIPEIGASDPAGPLGAGPVADEPSDMDVDGMGDDPVADPMDDMDGGMDGGMDGAMDAPVDPMGDEGVPGELGADPVEMPGDDMGMDVPDMDAPMDPTGAPMAPPVGAPMGMGASMAPQQSDAMAQIEDSLNSIQTGLADIRLSEYKSLIQKLQDLTNQAQMMGRDYLGESAMRRKK